MREYRVGDVVQVTKSGKHNGKIGVIVMVSTKYGMHNPITRICVSFDLNEVPLDQTYEFYNTRNGVNSSWYNASNVEPASYEDSFGFMREQVISLSSNIGKTIQGKDLYINEVDKETLVNTMQYAIQFKKEEPLYKENRELLERIQGLEAELSESKDAIAECHKYLKHSNTFFEEMESSAKQFNERLKKDGLI